MSSKSGPCISFIWLSRLRWISHVNRMDKERKVYNIFYKKPQGTRVRGSPKNRWMDCVLSDIKQNARLGTGRSSQGIEGYGGGPLWKRKPALGCNVNDEDEVNLFAQCQCRCLLFKRFLDRCPAQP